MSGRLYDYNERGKVIASGLRCPSCGADRMSVTDSRATSGGAQIRRRRECGECGQRFTTREIVAEEGPILIRADGRAVPVDLESFRAAALASIADGVEAALSRTLGPVLAGLAEDAA